MSQPPPPVHAPHSEPTGHVGFSVGLRVGLEDVGLAVGFSVVGLIVVGFSVATPHIRFSMLHTNSASQKSLGVQSQPRLATSPGSHVCPPDSDIPTNKQRYGRQKGGLICEAYIHPLGLQIQNSWYFNRWKTSFFFKVSM